MKLQILRRFSARKVQPAVSQHSKQLKIHKVFPDFFFFFFNGQATFFKCKIVEAAGSGPKTGAGGSRWVSDGTTAQLKLHFVLVGFGVASMRHPTEPGNRAKHPVTIDLQVVTVQQKPLELL